MANTAEGERLLYERWPTAEDLRKEFPYMDFLLTGRFAEDAMEAPLFNVYENGNVVSRELMHSKHKKNPTIGVILPGSYAFPTGNNTETLTVLDGVLEASVNNGGLWSLLNRDGTIVAPAGATLNLQVDKASSPVFYICRYAPKGSEGVE
jgi:uncharacterized protein YaiE (UPF0345 family)